MLELGCYGMYPKELYPDWELLQLRQGRVNGFELKPLSFFTFR